MLLYFSFFLACICMFLLLLSGRTGSVDFDKDYVVVRHLQLETRKSLDKKKKKLKSNWEEIQKRISLRKRLLFNLPGLNLTYYFSNLKYQIGKKWCNIWIFIFYYIFGCKKLCSLMLMCGYLDFVYKDALCI